MAYNNWLHEDLVETIEHAAIMDDESVTLSVKHSSEENKLEVLRWIEEMGYKPDLQEELCTVILKQVNSNPCDQLTDEDILDAFEVLLSQLSNEAHVSLKEEYGRMKQEILRRMSR